MKKDHRVSEEFYEEWRRQRRWELGVLFVLVFALMCAAAALLGLAMDDALGGWFVCSVLAFGVVLVMWERKQP